MRAWYVACLFCLGIACDAWGQAVVIRPVPADASATTNLRMPNGVSTHSFLRSFWILRAEDLAAVPLGVALSRLGATYTGGTDTPAGGQITFYLQNTADTGNLKSATWATAIADMTKVYEGAWNLPVGTATPAVVDVDITPFNYTGGGLYVAVEYSGTTFASQPANYAADTVLAGATRTGTSTTALPATLTAVSAFRPQLRLSFPNPYLHDIAVQALSAEYGTWNKLWGENRITVQLMNQGVNDQGNIPVTLQLGGANSRSTVLTVPALAAGVSTTLVQDMAASATGMQTVSASLPTDEQPANNQQSVPQQVSCSAVSYASPAAPFDAIGFNTGSGILAARYTAPAVPVVVESVTIGISNASGNLGNTVAGRLLDAAGNVVGSSAPVVLGPEHLGQQVVFPLATPVTVAAGADFYAGLLQSASTPGYFPVGTVAPATTAAGRFFTFGSAGGSTQTEYTTLGHLQIGANVHAPIAWNRSPAGLLVQGQPVLFTADAGFGSYRFRVNGAIAQQGAGATFSYVPTNGDVVTLEAERNGCEGVVAQSFTLPVVARDFQGTPPGGTGAVSAAFTGGGPACSFSTARFVAPSSMPVAPPSGLAFAHGLFEFAATQCTPQGSEAAATLQVTLTYPQPLPPGTRYWKFRPGTGEWYVLPGAVVDGNQIRFTLVDGSADDSDGAVDGTLTDPGGPAVQLSSQVAAIPTLPASGLWLLSALLALAGGWWLQRARR